MATIEPRLIALLNNDGVSEPYNTSSYPPSPSLELPPLQDPNILKASGRPLILEPDASKRNEKLQRTNLRASSHEDDENPKSKEVKNCVSSVPDRAIGGSSPQSLRKILDTGSTLAVPSKKRNIVEASKDDFVQLPQPPKKQKAAKQVVPPIIIGLFEPPPQATLFPPIASSSFHDSHGRNSLNIVTPTIKELRGSQTSENLPNIDKRSASRQKEKKDVKARKKWTEQETKNLLLGVHKHGVGKWTDILDDPSFSFNARSGVDLKDRFRTCCPEELRRKPPKARNLLQGPNTPNTSKIPKSSLMTENILIEDDEINVKDNGSETSSMVGLRKNRAHRKRMEDLAELGIDGPFRKSRRRERRPFTEQDDREILAGYHVYGPAWTRIQRDSKYHLQNRQATDLRDRFRNKFPEKFRTEEVMGRGDNRSDRRDENAILAPTASMLQSSREGLKIHQIISDAEGTGAKMLPLQTQTAHFGFKESFAEQADGLAPFDWTVNAPFTESIGEMDISRLLLDEPWIDSSRSKEKQPFTGINSILTSTADGLPHVSSYYGMLVNDEQIQIPSSVNMDHETSF
jgi:hypothetical protein